MATIETIRPSFYLMTEQQQMQHIIEYRERRFLALSTPEVDMKADIKRASRGVSRAKAIPPEVKALAAALGVSAKKLMELREGT